jgi:hypothetical protein
MLSKHTSTREIPSSLKALRHRELYPRHQPASGIIKDFVFSQLKEMSPEVKEEIELKIAQSLPRSRLNKLAT